MSHAGGVMGALQHAHIFRGHISPSLSSGFAAAALCAVHVRKLGGESPLPSLMVAKG